MLELENYHFVITKEIADSGKIVISRQGRLLKKHKSIVSKCHYSTDYLLNYKVFTMERSGIYHLEQINPSPFTVRHYDVMFLLL